jgi:hypothetical protein
MSFRSLRCVRIIAERLLKQLCLSVRLYVFNNSETAEWIFIKFYIWEFYEKLSSTFSFGHNWKVITGTLYEAVLAVLRSEGTVGIVSSRGFTRPFAKTKAQILPLRQNYYAKRTFANLFCITVLCR